jgi:arylsulfatase A-like enzyme
MTSGSSRSALLGRGLAIAACAGACVGLADVVRALATSRREMLQARDALEVVLFYVAFFAPCGLVAALAARFFDMPRRALNLLVVVGATWFFVAAWVNETLLPGFATPTSLIADVVMLALAALWFRRQYRLTALDGMRLAPWLVVGGASLVLALGVAKLVPSRGDGPTPQAACTAARRPNVLVYLCDTLRPDHLGCYGYDRPSSAEIDAFAKDATRFADCRAVTSWTKPSVASLLTSLMPTVHACVEQREVLVPEAETLPEVFRAAGWRTAAFVDNPFVTPAFGFGQGFDDFDYVRPSVVASGTLLGKALFMASIHLPVGETVRRMFGLGVEDSRGCAALHASLLSKFGDAKSAPWFAYVHAMEPHLCALRYQPQRADAEALGFPPGAPYLGPPPYNGILPFETAPAMPEDDLRRLVTQYDACIRGFSRGFGGLIDELRRRGILENTIVVFVADHGEEFHEHGGWTHGQSLHGELTRVPLIVRLPDSLGPAAKASRGRTVGGVATLLDVFPTLTALCGVKYPRGEERPFGLSLVDQLTPPAGKAAPDVPPRRLFAEVTMSPVGIRSIREGRWQLIVANEPLHEAVELYDDVSDPKHKRNRIDDDAVEAAQLRATLDEWFKLFDKIKLDRAEIELDAETRTRIKGLGYIGK